jgi:hypothetical protein
MPILPLRALGDIGIITDINPYDLPANALSQGNNLRFDDRKILRSPAFKAVADTTALVPVFCYSYAVPGLSDRLGIINEDGSSYFFDGATQEDVTPAIFTPTVTGDPFTHCVLGNVSYINRSSDVPQFYSPTSTDYEKLTNWPATYTCRALRAYKSFLLALNVSKNGVENPTMVKWSDITLTNSIPASWDETDPTLSAGENTLDEATSALLDGVPLRDSFILYCKDQVHQMDYTADHQIFRFRKLFDGPGIINTNCAVEIEGMHYVFGRKDIYAHDGVSFKSIIKGKNRKYVYDNLVNDESNKFFVAHDENLREIHFCYLSADGEAGYPDATYCNRSAVFNYSNGTWAFRDLPNCTFSAPIALDYSATTYITVAPATYADFGGSYSDLEDSALKVMQFTSVADAPSAITASRLYAYDTYYDGHISFPITAEANKPAWAERIGIDLDETGEGIRAYKVFKSIYPQAKALGGTGNLLFSFGATEYNDLTPTFSATYDFDPTTNHKVDTRIGGRYLAWRVSNPTDFGFVFTGFDMDVQVTGRR